MTNTILKTSQLSKTYTSDSGVSVNALKDINLQVDGGEILMLTGPNGSGKTTLLSLLGGLMPATSGSLSINSTDISDMNEKRRAKFRLQNIGFVFQSFRLLDALTVRENIELVPDLAKQDKKTSRDKTNQLLDELNIKHRADFYPGVLSGGEKQRVAIARALINDPHIILADEPTGSLDSRAGQSVIELLCKMAEAKNKTVIIVSHDLRIKKYVHRVLNIEDGKII